MTQWFFRCFLELKRLSQGDLTTLEFLRLAMFFFCFKIYLFLAALGLHCCVWTFL